MRNAVLVRDLPGEWREPESTTFTNERELQSLVNESPQLLTGVALATVAEFWIPDIGSVDLIGVGSDGAITVVECKLRANPEIRREVVGQVLAYAGGLWQMSYDDFESTWRSRAGSELHEHVGAKTGAEVDGEELRRAVMANLAAGTFTLLIVVDDITDELKRVVEYLNIATRDEITVLALELQYLKDAGKEILIPRTYGEALRETKGRAANNKVKWNAETFGAAVEALPESQRGTIERLLAHGREHDGRPWWGVGQVPGMSYYYKVGAQQVSLFQIYLRQSGPVVAVSLGAVASAKSLGSDVSLEFLKRLQDIPALKPIFGHLTKADINKYPSIPVVEVLEQEDVTSAFLAVIDWMCDMAAHDLTFTTTSGS